MSLFIISFLFDELSGVIALKLLLEVFRSASDDDISFFGDWNSEDWLIIIPSFSFILFLQIYISFSSYSNLFLLEFDIIIIR